MTTTSNATQFVCRLKCGHTEVVRCVISPMDTTKRTWCTKCGQSREVRATDVSFLSAEGNALLDRAIIGHLEGKVGRSLLHDTKSVLLDGCEWYNDAIDEALKEVGA
jgi:transcription elongation factor Elf1